MSCGSFGHDLAWPDHHRDLAGRRIANVCGHRLTRHRTIARAGDVSEPPPRGARPAISPIAATPPAAPTVVDRNVRRVTLAMCTPLWGGRWRSGWSSCHRPVTAWYARPRAPDHCLAAPVASTGREGPSLRSSWGRAPRRLSRLTRVSIAGSGFRRLVARVGCPGEVEAHRVARADQPVPAAAWGIKRASPGGCTPRWRPRILPSRVKEHSLDAAGGELLGSSPESPRRGSRPRPRC